MCYFLAGTLPIEAIDHLRQLSILRMIMESKGNILHKHSLNTLHSKPSSLSWFHQLRTLCLQYQLPHPLTLLQSSLTKPQFKAAKKDVLYYWEKKLRNKASLLPTLRYSSKSICLQQSHMQYFCQQDRHHTKSLKHKCKSYSYQDAIDPRSSVNIGPTCAGKGFVEDKEHL